jgi:hypothetical protein
MGITRVSTLRFERPTVPGRTDVRGPGARRTVWATFLRIEACARRRAAGAPAGIAKVEMRRVAECAVPGP